MPKVKRTVETIIFYPSRLRGTGKGVGLRWNQEVRGEGGMGYKRLQSYNDRRVKECRDWFSVF